MATEWVWLLFGTLTASLSIVNLLWPVAKDLFRRATDQTTKPRLTISVRKQDGSREEIVISNPNVTELDRAEVNRVLELLKKAAEVEIADQADPKD